MKYILTLLVILLTSHSAMAYDTYNSPEFYRHYGKQQMKVIDTKGNTVYVTPNFNSYRDRNNNVSEKIVAIYDKHAPEGVWGVRYVIYTPIGNYIGHKRMTQPSPNGYGYAPIYDGGEFSDTPCFDTIEQAKKYYYPNYKPYKKVKKKKGN